MPRPRLVTVTFEEVSITPERSGTCAKCGKPCRRKKKFYQTLSPFNKNAQGLRKTASEIREELTAEYRKWLETTPLNHVKCED